jgi:hypothetical protein
MKRFIVTFEDVGFATRKAIRGQEMTPIEAKAFTEVSIAEGTLPVGIKAVLGGEISTSPEEGDRRGAYKVFVGVRVIVEAADEASVYDLEPPAGLLSRLADFIAGNYHLALEGGWEVADVEPEAEATQRPSALPA